MMSENPKSTKSGNHNQSAVQTVYPKYKPSGVEWIGEIPEHWDKIKLKYIAKVQSSNVDKKTIEGEIPILLCNYVDVYKNEFIDDSFNFMEATATEREIEKFILKKGNVLITKDSETPDDIANPTLVKKDFDNVICGYHLAQIYSKQTKLLGNFLFRLFQTKQFNSHFEVSANGVTRFGLPLESITDVEIIIPNESEQTAIANYLDDKTAKIDTLIEKKKKLIDLFKEERAAIINQAVTRGIDPDVKLKPSGIDWLGDIPEHWEMKKLKYLTKTISKGTTPSTIGSEVLSEGKIRFLKAENILQSNKISKYPEFFIDEETNQLLKRSELHETDILIVIAGATIGKIGILFKELLPANTNQAVCFIRLIDSEKSQWIWLFFQSHFIKQTIFLASVQAAQPNLSMESIGNFSIVLTEQNEILEIIQHIEIETKRIDETIYKIEKEIELLAEYRTALISEVVTGKIKVTDNSNPLGMQSL
ncbi:MAG: restriction endonuclease subunit S [Calditrichaceae bacterium]|nr:restriction endonuclease subunit S [Calditrichaceae bacterium]MBN2710238.1 restriction endonuclease subunit S [Calditrichaceae bacterium]RQV93862.1 MAG: restriction endonuclease subunit S [Calditrichota bacterium]